MCIFCVSLNLTIVLFGAKTEAEYRDVAPLSKVTLRCPLTLWRDAHSQQNDYYKRQDFHPLLTLREENNFLRLPRYRARMDNNFPFTSLLQGRSQDFSKWGGGGGGHTG